ncbi:unnamed protein product, partial [marine sediment metagenome]
KTYSSPSLTREGDKGGRLLRKYKGDRVNKQCGLMALVWWQ